MAQVENTIENLWEKYQNNYNPKDRIEVLDSILTLAKKYHKDQHYIKAFIQKQINSWKLTRETEDTKNFFKTMFQEFENSPKPSKNILAVYIAKVLNEYFETNRFKIIGRTHTLVDSLDPETWDAQEFAKQINKYFLIALNNPEELRQIPAQEYKALINFNYQPNYFYPVKDLSLYDVIVYEATNFWRENNVFGKTSTNEFFPDNEKYIAPLPIFLKTPINAEGQEKNFLFYALYYYKQWLQYLWQEQKFLLLTKADLLRLDFVKNYLQTDKDIEDLYLRTLKETEKFLAGKTDFYGVYTVEIVKWYKHKGEKFIPTLHNKNYKERYYLKKAVEIVRENENKEFPEFIRKNLRELKKEITEVKKLALKIHDFVNKEDFPVLIKYRNVNSAKITIYEINKNQYESFRHYIKKDFSRKEYSLNKVYEEQINLPQFDDYLTHSLEYIVPKLNTGFYVIKITNSEIEDFDFDVFQVSNIAYTLINDNKKLKLLVTDRTTGKAIQNADVKVIMIENYSRKRTEIITGKTSTDGIFEFSPKKFEFLEELTITTNDDKLYNKLRLYTNLHQYSDNWNKSLKTVIFTDRAIYRPNQIIHFKGVLYYSDEDRISVAKNVKEIEILLRDANYEIVARKKVSVNDYGSFFGTLKIPEGRLTGKWHILIEEIGNYNGGYKSIRVEEYKIPKFFVKLFPYEKDYKIGDKITIKGQVNSYAGVPLSNVNVLVNIERSAYIPRRYWWFYWYPKSKTTHLLTKNVKTNNKGEFFITFTLLPDKTMKKDKKPVFEFHITAEATDETGETQATSKTIIARYEPINILIETSRDKNKPYKTDSVEINTTNNSGKSIQTSGKLLIYKMETPTRVLYPRRWETPDTFIHSKTEFVKLLPHFPYLDEDNIYKYPEEKLIYERSIVSGEKYDLDEIKSAGVYKIVVKINFKGQEYTEETFVEFDDYDNKKLAYPSALKVFADTKKEYKPGDKIKLYLMSSLPGMQTYLTLNSLKTHKELLPVLIKNYYEYEYTVQEQDKGGIRMKIFAGFPMKDAYRYLLFNIPWEDKRLQFHWIRFRDKLKPGEQTEWQLKITTNENKPVSAEVLANMYNKALDDYVPNAWHNIALPHLINAYVRMISTNVNPNNKQVIISNVLYGNILQLYMPQFNFVFPDFYGGYFYRSMAIEDEFAGDDFSVQAQEKPRPKRSAKTKSAEAPQGTPAPAPQVPPKTKEIKVRKKLQETAFFYHTLYTDENGNLTIKFTAPEELSTWKFMLFAHSKDLANGLLTKEVITQKEIMIQPFFPRFFYEGDKLILKARISTPTDLNLSGNSTIEFLDPITEQVIPEIKITPIKTGWELQDENKNTTVKWEIEIPDNLFSKYQFIAYRIYTWTDDKEFTDAEQNLIPIKLNRTYLVETFPITITKGGNYSYDLKHFREIMKSRTADVVNYTLEFTTNPIWEVIKSLPYLLEYPYECNEQTFNRIYANTISLYILKKYPQVARVIRLWAESENKSAFLSKLEKNPELKMILLKETPWLIDAKTEKEQKQHIAELLNEDNVLQSLRKGIKKIKESQQAGGGIPWFPGMKPSKFVSQYIAIGVGKLKEIKALETLPAGMKMDLLQIADRAVPFIDKEEEKYFYEWKKYIKDFNPDKNYLDYSMIYFLYYKSFYKNTIEDVDKKMWNFYLTQAEKHSIKLKNLFLKSLSAISLHKIKPASAVPVQLVENMSQYLLKDDDKLGCRVKNVYSSYAWYENDITTQTYMINAFYEIAPTKYAEDIKCMQIWLINNKRMNHWGNTIRTADAIYTLLKTAPDVLQKVPKFTFQVGDEKLQPDGEEVATGNFKKVFTNPTAELTKIKITAKDVNIVSWGGVFLQYYEQLDKVRASQNQDMLKISRSFYKIVYDEAGEKAIPLQEPPKVGDKILVRLQFSVKENMSYVFLKDNRFACVEPVERLSGYRYNNGVFYYLSLRDASMNFFFDYLPAGNYIVEYKVYVTHSGEFVAGPAIIQNMYAPEFSAYTKGGRMEVGE